MRRLPVIAAVSAVIRLIRREIGAVLLDRVALFQSFIECAGPGLSLSIKAKVLHQLLRVQFFDCDSKRRFRGVAFSNDTERGRVGQPGDAEVSDLHGAHCIQVLLMGHRVDGNEPDKVVFVKAVDHLDPVDLLALALIFVDNAGYNRVHLGMFKLFQTHIDSADSHGLLGHVGNRVRIRGFIAEKDVGKRSKHHHRNDDQND